MTFLSRSLTGARTMRFSVALAVSTAIGVSATAVAAQQEAPRVPAGTNSIAGRVIDRTSRQPIAAAMVALLSSKNGGVLRTTTDGDGRYLIEGIGPGEYRVSASQDGYLFGGYRGEAGTSSLPEDDGRVRLGSIVFTRTVRQAKDGVDIYLDRAGEIAGRVTHRDGSPVNAATVKPLLLLPEGGALASPSTYVQTNEHGEYVVRVVRPGPYRISVDWVDPDRLKPRTRTTYFPGTHVPDDAVAVQVEAGSMTRSIDFVLAPEDRYRISGQALHGVVGGRLEAFLISPQGAARAVPISSDGAFEIAHLEPGRYTVCARASAGPQSEAGTITLDLGSDVRDLMVPLASTSEIVGRVVTEEGEPDALVGAQVVADLLDEDGRPIDSFASDRVDIGRDGGFRLKGLFGRRALRLVGTQREADRVLSGQTPIHAITLGVGERVEGITIVAVRR